MGEPWAGVWITDGEYHFKEKGSSPKPMYFKKRIKASDKTASVKIYITAIGIYDLFLDGEKVGSDYFAPGFTSYQKELQYQTYDLTEKFLDGKEHALMAVIAGGWAVGRYTYKNRNRIYADRQALLAEVVIKDQYGQIKTIGTDETWETTIDGTVKEAEFYNGEVYDARVDMENVNWHKASRENIRLHPQIIAGYGLPVRAHEVFQPISVKKSKTGVLVYDFGQNFAGVIRAKIKGKSGQKIVFTHAEVLMDGELYREPLRSAKQEAVYICKDGEQEYSPTLTYMGFRYVGVTGIAESMIELSAVALYSDIENTGSFTCSDDMINKLQKAITWGARSNFVDIPTDCPQRDERLGWTGDIALFAPTALYNFNMKCFLEKWLKDVRAEQRWGGGIPMIIPFTKVYWQWELVVTMAVDHWGDACILVPWALYLKDGDISLLKKMYPTMKRYVKACRFWAGLFSFGKHRYIWKLLHHYGDWVAPAADMWTWMGRGKYTATAALARSTGLLSRIADILHKDDEALKYKKLHDKTSEAYRDILMDKDCRIKNEFQTGYVLPLYYDMLDEEDRKKTAENLVKLVRKNDHHIGTGFPGTPYVLFALADNGYVDDAYQMLLCDSCPSWLYEIKTGGTTIWERWDALREDGTCNTGKDDGTGGMVSFNHYASGAVGDFLYRRIAGIEAVTGGYRNFRIVPVLGGGITSAAGKVDTAYGIIESSWKIEEGKFSINVKIPVGTECELVLPDGTKEKLSNGSYIRSCSIAS